VASAAGFGVGGSGAVLGQPLDFAVQVRLDAGEVLTPECVSAEITAGDQRVPPPLVRTRVEWQGPESARIRVFTLVGIDEPVIGINLSSGCSSRVSRRYVVLADPPELAVAPALTPLVLAAAPAPDPGRAPAPASEAAANPTPPRAAAVTSRPAPRNTARSVAAGERRSPGRPAAAARRDTTSPARATESPARLKLDLVEPGVHADAAAIEQALEAVAEAASAARAAASAASSAAERISALEHTVEQLRGEARTGRDLATELRERLVWTEGSSRWLLPLMIATAVLAALAAWLAWRLGSLQKERQREWRGASAQEPRPRPPPPPGASRQPTLPIPFVTSEINPEPPPPQAPRNGPARPPAAPPEARRAPAAAAEAGAESPLQRTEVLPPSVRADEGPARDVSIEELIDLEQQAEFFVVLGQDEAAIELLAEHLRSTGGGSPLPYLKLLEIFQRRGDRAAYERMRTRFNHRFNAYAPDWGADLQGGRSLEDYAGIIPRLQQVWSRPLDAMAELEALLFRKSRGELFELRAYREVLFLYSLARDLFDHESVDTTSVDLLLPLAEGGEFGSTAPIPFLGLGPHAGDEHADFDERPTSPVDFDPSVPEPPTSIFDPLAPRPGARH
jgi:hypothetical protein